VSGRRRQEKGETEDGKQRRVGNVEARALFLAGLLFCCGSLFYQNAAVCQAVHSDGSPFLLHFFLLSRRYSPWYKLNRLLEPMVFPVVTKRRRTHANRPWSSGVSGTNWSHDETWKCPKKA
jgi:hypothetical protein